jgi:hypothetical protein
VPTPTLPPVSSAITNPILFVTQQPTPGEVFASRTSTFANHIPATDRAPRGGGLMIRYPDGSLRNLTAETGFSSVAVREPSVHWDGSKAVFSMVGPSSTWQIYEVTGIAKGQTAVVRKLPGQPAYNNVSPLYGTDDKIIFTSDATRAPHLYPHLDEYESTPTITGLFSLDPASASFRMLNHTPSGAFSPTIDSFGRVIFTRWDHLVQDQQADSYAAYNTASEAAGATRLARSEVFPEQRFGTSSSPYGTVNQHQFNLFQPWQMNQDGTAELTMNHVGRHELQYGFMGKSFANDATLADSSDTSLMSNRKLIRIDGGIFHIKEDPRSPGLYYGTYAREFGSMSAAQLVRFTGAPNLNAEQMTVTAITAGDGESSFPAGRFRDPLPLSTGAMVAVHSASASLSAGIQFRLKLMNRDAAGNVTAGNLLTNLSGALWELEPVEVVARARPGGKINDGLDAAAKQVLAEEGVTESELQTWLRANSLALIVTNNQTSRDRSDRQQPYNLQVPGGVKSAASAGTVYPIQHYQIIEGQQVRGYSIYNDGIAGRRVIGQPMTQGKNKANPGGPAGSVKIFPDGSTAAFVPTNRALAWQTTDAGGTPIVRERVWVTMQPGETRTCTGCHGANTKDQAGLSAPVNKPEALRDLLRHWKALPK